MSREETVKKALSELQKLNLLRHGDSGDDWRGVIEDYFCAPVDESSDSDSDSVVSDSELALDLPRDVDSNSDAHADIALADAGKCSALDFTF